MRLLLVPHAATDWNAEGRYQGHSDRPLSAIGHRQAARLSERLADKPLHSVVASDLRRAAETAEIIAEGRQLTVQLDSRLRELSFGTWEGQTYAEVQEADAERLRDWERDVLRNAPPSGETLSQMAARVKACYLQLTTEASEAGKEETTLVVAHRGSLQIFLCLALGLPPQSRWQFRLELASLSEVNLHPQGGELARLNDTHHLWEAVHAG